MRPACGSSRCSCDHTGCDYGWLTVTRIEPNGQTSEAARKCPGCFPMPEPSTRSSRILHPDARDIGAEYADAARAAAGDKE